jgi:hypothetical protein
MFVIRHGRRGRVMVHRAACALLIAFAPDDQESARSFEEAYARASQLTRPATRRPHVCGWCRPDKS